VNGSFIIRVMSFDIATSVFDIVIRMKAENERFSSAGILYQGLSRRPFELITHTECNTRFGLSGRNLYLTITEARQSLSPNEAIFGVHGEGYVFTDTPVSAGDIVPVSGIRPFPRSWLERYPAHAGEVSGLVDLLQKGIVTGPDSMKPVLSKEPYVLLLRFIRAYTSSGMPISVDDITFNGDVTYTYNLVARVREGLSLATGNLWSISQKRNDGHYFLHQAAAGTDL
jgi:hypothetical protein